MGSDLAFWKYSPRNFLLSRFRSTPVPALVYEKLCNEQELKILETLPIDDILARVTEEFSSDMKNVENNDNGSFWENDEGSFQMHTTAQSAIFSIYGLDTDYYNRIIEILIEFGCPLYDPQVDKRFDGNDNKT